MKVCIVGASGKLGQYMVQHALDRGYELVGVCREQSVAKRERGDEQRKGGGPIASLTRMAGSDYVLVGSLGGAPKDPVWVHNLRANPNVEIRDETAVRSMRVREVEGEAERSRLWKLAVAAYPPYAEYQERTTRRIPVFIAERP